MALSPDGSTICSGSADETLRFWRVFDNNSNMNNGYKDNKRGDELNPISCSLR
jgi:WD40 repeat protein